MASIRKRQWRTSKGELRTGWIVHFADGQGGLPWAKLLRRGTIIRSGEVRRLAKQAKDAGQARRVLAVAGVTDWVSRRGAAKIRQIDRANVRGLGDPLHKKRRDWVVYRSLPSAAPQPLP